MDYKKLYDQEVERRIDAEIEVKQLRAQLARLTASLKTLCEQSKVMEEMNSAT